MLYMCSDKLLHSVLLNINCKDIDTCICSWLLDVYYCRRSRPEHTSDLTAHSLRRHSRRATRAVIIDWIPVFVTLNRSL